MVDQPIRKCPRPMHASHFRKKMKRAAKRRPFFSRAMYFASTFFEASFINRSDSLMRRLTIALFVDFVE